MLVVLSQVEQVLPSLLQNEAIWKDVDVDYHPPHVERMWCDWEGYRVYLHRIHPCAPGEALFHPHPWPSAMHVLSGMYEMTVGYGPGKQAPPVASTLLLPSGTRYEMVHPDGWHAVRPIDVPAYSLMITGKPWDRWSPKSDKPLGSLTPQERSQILDFFRSHYPV